MNENNNFTVGFDNSFVDKGITQERKTEVQTKTNIVPEPKQNLNNYNYKTVYAWFIKNKDPSIPFEIYLRTKPEIYLLFGLIPFEPLPNNIIDTVENFKNKCFDDVDKTLSNTNERIEIGVQIKECLLEIENVFKYYDNEESNFENSLRQNLYEKLYVSLREKEFDGVLELTEVESLLKVAKQLYLWDGKSKEKRQEILDWIKDKTEQDECRFESYIDTFIRKVRNKPQFDRLNVQTCKSKLFMEYWALKGTELELQNKPIEINKDELASEMQSVLSRDHLLVDNKAAYLETFFNIEKIKSGKDYSLKLPSDYYQSLKTIAISMYYFTEQQWEQFAHEQKISKLSDMSVAFILGTQKASSIENIATLLENNQSKAIERIIDGDLETYLRHIEQHQLAKEIEQAKTNFKEDKIKLFTSVLNILRGIKDTSEEDTTDVDDRQTLLAIINRDAPVQEMVQYLLKRKTREKLNQRILSESNDRKDLNGYLEKKNISFVCLCMNYLRDFPNESNASGYANIYELYANYVLDVLINKNAYCLFYSGFIHLINYEYISQSFKDKINDVNNKMQKDFESFCSTVNKKSKKKPFFGL